MVAIIEDMLNVFFERRKEEDRKSRSLKITYIKAKHIYYHKL